jgi:hypothetical protein
MTATIYKISLKHRSTYSRETELYREERVSIAIEDGAVFKQIDENDGLITHEFFSDYESESEMLEFAKKLYALSLKYDRDFERMYFYKMVDGTETAFVPKNVTMRQARLALLKNGLLDVVNSGITDPSAKIEWEYATEVERNNVLVTSLKSLLNLSEQDVDNLFILAAIL